MKTTHMTRVLTMSLAATALFAIAASAQTPINVVSPTPIITVTGDVTVEVTPDQATVRIGIVHQGGNAKEAQDEASRITRDTLKAIGDLGVPSQQVQTSRLTINPNYVQPRPGSGDAPRITSYTASNVITVTLNDLALVGPIVDAGLLNGANQLEGVQFQLRNDGPPREQALRVAVAEAKRKATAIAEALGVPLGAVQEVAENGISVVPLASRSAETFAVAARAAVPTPVSAGQLEVRASVILKYAIESKN
ncbi:MAG TPA: SIMPL domain-containing protein [Terriglobia bacterium]|nr:SIMPL domain-containing protein [Terriglobia bacterium]